MGICCDARVHSEHLTDFTNFTIFGFPMYNGALLYPWWIWAEVQRDFMKQYETMVLLDAMLSDDVIASEVQSFAQARLRNQAQDSRLLCDLLLQGRSFRGCRT